MQSSQSELLQRVQGDRGKTSPAAIVCQKLLGVLKPEAVSSVTASMVVRLCSNMSYNDILDALMYLSSERIGLFRFKIALLDEKEEFYDLEPEDVAKFFSQGENPRIVNPITNEYIDKEKLAEEAVFYFSGTEFLASLLKEVPCGPSA